MEGNNIRRDRGVARALAGVVLLLSAAVYLAELGLYIADLLRPGTGVLPTMELALILYAVAALMCLLSVIRYRRGAYIVCAGVAAMAALALSLYGMRTRAGALWLMTMAALLLLSGGVVVICGLWWGRYVKRRGGAAHISPSFPFFRAGDKRAADAVDAPDAPDTPDAPGGRGILSLCAGLIVSLPLLWSGWTLYGPVTVAFEELTGGMRVAFGMSVYEYMEHLLAVLSGGMCLIALVLYKRGAYIACAGALQLLARVSSMIYDMSVIMRTTTNMDVLPTDAAGWMIAAFNIALWPLLLILTGVWWDRHVKKRGGPARVRKYFPFLQEARAAFRTSGGAKALLQRVRSRSFEDDGEPDDDTQGEGGPENGDAKE